MINESLAGELEAKQRSINAMLSGGGSHQAHQQQQQQQWHASSHASEQTVLGQAVAQKVAGSKEAVLRKLLETQDAYIHELEAKCKAMTAQLISDHGDSQVSFLGGGLDSQAKFSADRIDLVQLETSSDTIGRKIQQAVHVLDQAFGQKQTLTQPKRNQSQSETSAPPQASSTVVVEYSNPVVGNVVNALTIIRNASNLEDMVQSQRTQQHASLVQAMQTRFQKDKDDAKAVFEQAEEAYESKVIQLEQELIVVKQHVRTYSQDLKTQEMRETLNAKVLEEMESLETRYKQSEQEFRQANSDLRRQLQSAQRGGREAQNSLETLQSRLGLNETQEYACIKRIEGQVRLIFKEFKSAHHKLLVNNHGSSSATQNNSHEATTQDQRLDRLLSQLNQQIRALDDELDSEFSSIVASLEGSTGQKVANAAGSHFIGLQSSEKQLQILLRDAQNENQGLREMLQKAELKEQERTQSVWIAKLDIVNNEKKVLQAEMKKLVDISSMRENMLTRDNETLAATIQQLKQEGQDREQSLQAEISVIKKQLASIMQQMKQTGNSLSQSVLLLGTPQAQQVAKDIQMQAQITFQTLIDGRENEIRLLRNLNENLSRQLKEANQLLGRSNSFEKQNGIGLIYSKLEVRLNELFRSVQDTLENLETQVAKQRNVVPAKRLEALQLIEEQAEQIQTHDRKMFEAQEEIMQLCQELEQAKMCLVQQISASQSSQQQPLDQVAQQPQSQGMINDANMINVLVEKFSQEIERLKASNAQLKLQKDNVVQFYKDEFARLWQKYDELPKPTEQQIRRAGMTISSIPGARPSQSNEAEETMDELRDLFQELQTWVHSLRAEEIKSLQDKVQLLHTKVLASPNIGVNSKTEGGKSKRQQQQLTQTTPRQQTAFDAANMARTESNFSFNYNAQRSLLYEEIEILREQANQIVDSYQRATQCRDTQFQVLAKERTLLKQREEILESTLEDAVSVMQASEQLDRDKAEKAREDETREIEHLKCTNGALIQKLQDEKAVSQRELEQVQSSYQEKFIQLKERETLSELQLAQLDKELKATQDSLWQIRSVKDQTVSSLNSEIASLKKFANQRQAELLETRRQVTLFYKKARDSNNQREMETKRLYKDSIGSHVKVLEIELKKLQKCSQKYEQ